MISIIIPTYNRAHFIHRAIESVLNQTYEDWELIIVDDGSTDNTETVVHEFSCDQRIKYLQKKKSGATHSRNVGVEKSTGDFITFLDSDDEAKPNWLESFFFKINQGAEIACCGFEYYDHMGNIINEILPGNLGNLYGNKIGRFSNGGVFILRKELFTHIGGYDVNLRSGQNSEMALRLVKVLDEKKIEICSIFEPLLKVHIHKGQKIRNDHDAIIDGTLYTLEKHLDLFKNNPAIFSNYLSIAAVSAIRSDKIKLAQDLFFKAWMLQPKRLKSILRWMISLIPVINKNFWNNS